MTKKSSLAAGFLLFAAVLACAVTLTCFKVPAGVDRAWLKRFNVLLPDKVKSSDAVVVGERVISLGDSGVVSLYHISEVMKGETVINRVMEAYPEVEESLFVAYEAPSQSGGHMEPSGKTLIFMKAPESKGKNLHLLGNSVDEGMIYALPSVVQRTRALCR